MTDSTTRIHHCRVCNHDKPLGDFPLRKNGNPYNTCRACYADIRPSRAVDPSDRVCGCCGATHLRLIDEWEAKGDDGAVLSVHRVCRRCRYQLNRWVQIGAEAMQAEIDLLVRHIGVDAEIVDNFHSDRPIMLADRLAIARSLGIDRSLVRCPTANHLTCLDRVAEMRMLFDFLNDAHASATPPDPS